LSTADGHLLKIVQKSSNDVNKIIAKIKLFSKRRTHIHQDIFLCTKFGSYPSMTNINSLKYDL